MIKLYLVDRSEMVFILSFKRLPVIGKSLLHMILPVLLRLVVLGYLFKLLAVDLHV